MLEVKNGFRGRARPEALWSGEKSEGLLNHSEEISERWTAGGTPEHPSQTTGPLKRLKVYLTPAVGLPVSPPKSRFEILIPRAVC